MALLHYVYSQAHHLPPLESCGSAPHAYTHFLQACQQLLTIPQRLDGGDCAHGSPPIPAGLPDPVGDDSANDEQRREHDPDPDLGEQLNGECEEQDAAEDEEAGSEELLAHGGRLLLLVVFCVAGIGGEHGLRSPF